MWYSAVHCEAHDACVVYLRQGWSVSLGGVVGYGLYALHVYDSAWRVMGLFMCECWLLCRGVYMAA